MTEPTFTPDPADASGEVMVPESQSNYTPPATQADLDRIIAERVARTKNQFKDYGELKKQADELAQIKAANQTEGQRQAEELSRWQSEAQTWRQAAVGHRIEALAAADFADPSDAVTALSGGDYLDAGGQIDAEAIKRDLADVLERKPHWKRQEAAAGGTRIPAPNPAQGSGGGRSAADPAQEFAALIRGQLGT